MVVCFKCGEIKSEPFSPCRKCGQEPKTEDEKIVAMAMTDHFLDKETLEEINDATKRIGRPPDMDPEIREKILKFLCENEPGILGAEKQVEGKKKQETGKKSWWKFW